MGGSHLITGFKEDTKMEIVSSKDSNFLNETIRQISSYLKRIQTPRELTSEMIGCRVLKSKPIFLHNEE